MFCYSSAKAAIRLLDPAGRARGAPQELTLKSIPTVEMKLPARKAPSLNRTSKQVFPTPESPTSITWEGGKGVLDTGFRDGSPTAAVTCHHPKSPIPGAGADPVL